MCTESVKITLFRSFCTSLYTCELWWNYRSETLRKLCVAYNNVFIFLCSEPRNCSASHMFVSRGLPTRKMLIRKSVYAFMASTNKKGKGMVLYSAVSSPLDRSKRFTLSSPGRPVHSDTVLGFSWKHSSHAAIAQRLFTHISTTVYSQVGPTHLYR